MTTMSDLITAALAAADLFREGDTPDQPEIRQLVREADRYQAEIRMKQARGENDCSLCTARAMVEGDPELWNPGEPAAVTGVVMRMGETNMGVDVPFVDLWIDGWRRIRVPILGANFRAGLGKAAPRIGDTLTVEYLGHRPILSGKFAGRLYRHHEVSVKQGHH